MDDNYLHLTFIVAFLIPWLLAMGWTWSIITAATLLRAGIPISGRVAALLYVPWALGIYSLGVVVVLVVASAWAYQRGETYLFPDWTLVEERIARAYGYERGKMDAATERRLLEATDWSFLTPIGRREGGF